jgi:hypothetical protein
VSLIGCVIAAGSVISQLAPAIDSQAAIESEKVAPEDAPICEPSAEKLLDMYP